MIFYRTVMVDIMDNRNICKIGSYVSNHNMTQLKLLVAQHNTVGEPSVSCLLLIEGQIHLPITSRLLPYHFECLFNGFMFSEIS